MSSHAPAVFEATYSDWKVIKGRKVVQIVVEIPMEKADQAYKVLGGMPNQGAEAWLAIARLQGKSRLAVETGNVTAQQAAIRCGQQKFREFLFFQCSVLADEILADDTPEQAADVLRKYFNVKSRKDIPDSEWESFEREYQLWLRA